MDEEIKTEVATEVASESNTAPNSANKFVNEEFLHMKRKRMEELEDILRSPQNTRLRHLLLSENNNNNNSNTNNLNAEIATEIATEANSTDNSPMKTNQKVSDLLNQKDFVKRYTSFGNSKEKAIRKYFRFLKDYHIFLKNL